MSWTSEFELPPQGPQVVPDPSEPDDDDSPEDQQVEDSQSPDRDQQAQATSLADIPDEGPLDPSVFDGLFDDLSEPGEEIETEVETEVEPASDDTSDASETADPDTESEEPDDVNENGVLLEGLDGAFTIGDLVVDEPPAVDELLDDEVFRPVDDDQDEYESGAEGEYEAELESEVDYDEDDQYDEAEYEADAEYAEDEPDEDVEYLLEDEDSDEYEEYEQDVEDEADELEDEAEDLDGDGDESQTNGSSPPDDDPPSAFQFDGPQLPVLDQTPPAFELFPSGTNGHQTDAEPMLLQREPAAAVATSPPIALDEPPPARNGAMDTPVHFEVPAAEVVDRYHPPAYDAPAKTRRWPSFVTAILIGGGLGIGGAIALIALQPDTENNGSTTPIVVDNGTAQPSTDGQSAGTLQTDGAAAGDPSPEVTDTNGSLLSADGSLLLNSIAFEPGTVELTEKSERTLQQVADAIADLPPEPTVLAVRTFSEATAQANRDLSIGQAEALGQYLSSLGVEFGGLSIRGLGAAPLGQAMPVENFVVVSPNLGADDLRRALDVVGSFEVGVDPDTLQLRPESVAALDRVGVAMATGQGTISLAGYSYDRPSDEANKAMAGAAVDAAKDYLATTHQIDPARISAISPGSLPYVVGRGHGGHVTLKRGRAAAIDVAIHSGDQTVLSFAAGSDALSGAATEELTRLSALLAESEANAVISVRSAGEPSAEANIRLSQLQAEAIAEFFIDTGLTDGQVRVYGVGDVARQRSDTVSSEVFVTIIG